MIGYDEAQQYGLGSLFHQSTHQKSFFLTIMILIMGCLTFRIFFLSIIFIQSQPVKFKYALWTDQFPNIFKLLIVVYICKYKLHIHFLAKR